MYNCIIRKKLGCTENIKMVPQRMLGSTTDEHYLRIRVLETYLNVYSSCKNCVSTAIKLLVELLSEASNLYIAMVNKVDAVLCAFHCNATLKFECRLLYAL